MLLEAPVLSLFFRIFFCSLLCRILALQIEFLTYMLEGPESKGPNGHLPIHPIGQPSPGYITNSVVFIVP